MGRMSRFRQDRGQAREANVPVREMTNAREIRQHIRYVTVSDGIRLAWAQAGEGPVVVKAANWLTHLEYEWESPLWRHWLRFFSTHFRFVRYDERGCGMSDWRTGQPSVDRWTDDLEAVIDAARPKEPVTLLGISQGGIACLNYAIRHPDRVARLILYGAYLRGAYLRGTAESRAVYRAMVELVRSAWGSDNPTFRQVFTSRFVPGARADQLQWFNELCRKSSTGENAAQLFDVRASVDFGNSVGAVRTPTLVLHARNDAVVPVEEGRCLAAGISGAEFVELDSANHVLLHDEPARSCSRASAGSWAEPRSRSIGLPLPEARRIRISGDRGFPPCAGGEGLRSTTRTRPGSRRPGW